MVIKIEKLIKLNKAQKTRQKPTNLEIIASEELRQDIRHVPCANSFLSE